MGVMGVDPFLLFFVELIFMGWGLALVWFCLALSG